MTAPTPRERAVDPVACCSHHVSSCGITAACAPCVAAALRAVEQEYEKKLAKRPCGHPQICYDMGFDADTGGIGCIPCYEIKDMMRTTWEAAAQAVDVASTHAMWWTVADDFHRRAAQERA